MPECRLIVLLEPVVLKATHSSIKCLHGIWFKMLRSATCRHPETVTGLCRVQTEGLKGAPTIYRCGLYKIRMSPEGKPDPTSPEIRSPGDW
jgi:hypothetical protein